MGEFFRDFNRNARARYRPDLLNGRSLAKFQYQMAATIRRSSFPWSKLGGLIIFLILAGCASGAVPGTEDFDRTLGTGSPVVENSTAVPVISLMPSPIPAPVVLPVPATTPNTAPDSSLFSFPAATLAPAFSETVQVNPPENDRIEANSPDKGLDQPQASPSPESPSQVTVPSLTELPTPASSENPTATPVPEPLPAPTPTRTPTPIPTPTASPTVVPTLTTPPVPLAAGMVIECILFDGVVPRTESDEYVQLLNNGASPVDINGWRLRDMDLNEKGQTFTFGGSHILPSGDRIRVYTNEYHPEWGGFSFGRGTSIWNNSNPDTAGLFNPAGALVSTRTYPPGCQPSTPLR